jgi:hypothetical protein
MSRRHRAQWYAMRRHLEAFDALHDETQQLLDQAEEYSNNPARFTPE